MHLNIALCDDEFLQVELANSYLNEIKKKYSIKIFKAYNGDEILRIVKENKIDIVFLDIQMEGLDGIEIGRRIRELSEEVIITYLTGYRGYALEAFEIKSFDYLIKPICKEKFINTFESIIRRINESRLYNSKQKHLVIKNRDEIIQLKYDEIYFFEKQQRRVKIYSQKGVFSYNGTLRELEGYLESLEFLQCHQGYFINKNKLFMFKKDEIIFRGIEKAVPVSRRYKKNIVRVLEAQLI